MRIKRFISVLIIAIILCSSQALAEGMYEDTDRGMAYIVTGEPEKIPVLDASTVTVLNADGTWHEDANGWWFEYSGGGYPSNTWEEIDSYWYYFNESGYMITGWIQVGGFWYFCETSDQAMAPHGSMITGWREVDNEWYFFETAGTNERPLGSMITGELKIGVKSYYFRTTKGTSLDGEEHPEGSMVYSMYAELDGERVYYNSQGERCKILSNKEKAIYALLGNDGTFDGGYVDWTLEAYLSNETEDEVKVTDRTALCTYFHPNYYGASFNLDIIPREYSETEDKIMELKWNSMDALYPSYETLALSVENHYIPEEPDKGDINYFDRDTDYELEFKYSYGLSSDTALIGTVKLENADITQTVIGGKDHRIVAVPYGNVPVEYNVSNDSQEELKDVCEWVRKINLLNNPLVYIQTENNGINKLATPTVYINKDSLDKMIQNFDMVGVENSEEKAEEMAIREAVLFAEAKRNNISVEDSDILNYRKTLEDKLNLKENELYQNLISACGGKEIYWNITKENYRIKLTINKYLSELVKKYYNDNDFEKNTYEYEQQWNEYVENLIEQLENEYQVIIK